MTIHTLAPTTGILLTTVQSGMTALDAVSEFADNVFGKAAGNADVMHMIETKDAVIFWDAGAGVKDINQLFRLGDGSSRNSKEDIGRFGVGSKFGALSFGTKVTVMTVRDGVFHKFQVDWGKVLETGNWPNEYSGKGQPSSRAPQVIRNGGTVIIVQDLHANKRRPKDTTYIKSLGLRFMPAFEFGKDILLSRAPSLSVALEGKAHVMSVRDEFDKLVRRSLRGKVDGEIVVNGMKASVMFGELKDGDKNLAGIHISYSGRVVSTITGKLNGQQLPSKLFARIDLSSDWKHHLNYNKTVITHDVEELESAIAEAGASIIERLSQAESEKLFEKLGAEISNMIDPKFGKNLMNEAGQWDEGDEGEDVTTFDPENTTDTPVNPDNPNESRPEPNKATEGDKKSRKGAFEIKLNPHHMGKDNIVSRAELVEDDNKVVCTVHLNLDVDIVKNAVTHNPANRPATMLLSAHALARFMVENHDWLERMFKGEEADMILSKSELEQVELAYIGIMKMVRSDD